MLRYVTLGLNITNEINSNYYKQFLIGENIMTRMKKQLMLITMLIIFTLFIFIFFNYLNKQSLLNIENNHLLTNNNIKIEETDKMDLIKDEVNKFPYWSFSVIEKEYENTIYGFFSNDYTKCVLPIEKGKMFKKNNTKEALVGKNIETIIVQNKEYFTYNGINYEVIGRIGFSYNSPIENYVVINDSSLFNENNEIYINSLDNKNLDYLKNKYVLESENFGLERWFNISYYINIISMVGLALIIMIPFLISGLLLKITEDRNNLLVNIGYNITKFVIKDIVYIIGGICLLNIVWYHVFIPMNFEILVKIFFTNLLMLIIILVVYLLIVYKFAKGGMKCS